ncbi:serine/threonine-protein kinase STY46-like [Aristolochia californica]|uniref:serine/threonine-protein kinase STY46-like n=1 Tax=Aristolochia californica TaxID=171875 RepID=UPI0035E00C13
MAAALECWSSRASPDDDMVEQVLVKTQPRSEVSSPSTSSKEPSKWQRLSRNFSGAINTLKTSLNLDSVRDPNAARIDGLWAGVVQNLTKLYPGSQLPEKLVSNIRKHFDSLPISYAQAGFDMKEVFLHMRLIEQSITEDRPAIWIDEVSVNQTQGAIFRLTFACNSSISLSAMSGALDNASVCCKKIQIFEKKSFTLGIIIVLVQSGQEKFFKSRVEIVLKSALKRPPKPASMKLPFGLCGCQEQTTKAHLEIDNEEDDFERNLEPVTDNSAIRLQLPLPDSTFVVAVDEWQTIQSGVDEIGKWLLNSDCIEFADQLGASSLKGIYKGEKVAIERLRGCEKGSAYEIVFRRDLLELMTCGHQNILHFHGVCIDENHGLCVVTKLMEGGTVQDLMQRGKKIPIKEVIRIAVDVAEGIKFMNDHGVPYRDLNTQTISLDRHGNACLCDMGGVVTTCRNSGEVTEYETAGYRWLAPEIIAGDPESVAETWMSNVYSFGMVVWEMLTGEVAYGSYSPVQAAVGIAACGLRPEIPKDCPPHLRSLMMKCWNNCPSKRPQFSEILSVLLRPSIK